MAVKPKLHPAVKLQTYKAVTQEGMRVLLEQHRERFASVAEAARDLDVTRAFYANMLSGEKLVSGYVAGRLGYAQQVLYVPIKTE